MPCHPFDFGDGGRGFVCTGRQRARKCIKCGRKADLLCDWIMPSKKSGTCDKALCSRCTTSPKPDKDLCPAHAQAFEQWKLEKQKGKSTDGI